MSKERRKGNPSTPTTSLYIHCVYHPQIICHASIYHPSILPWSHTPPRQLLSIQPHHNIQCRNTSNHFLIITNYTATIFWHSHALSTSTNISIFPSHLFLPHILIPFPGTLQSITCKPEPWQCPPSRFEVLREHSAMALASWDDVGGTHLLLVAHSQTLLVPMSKNHTRSTVYDTATDSGTSDYPYCSRLDILPRHQLPLEVVVLLVVP